jgi:hypothetical protein
MGGNRPPENTAKILLRRILPETQWEQFNETETVEIPGSRGIYRVSTRELTRVLDPQTRRPRASACLQLTVPALVHDRVIAEYMLIQTTRISIGEPRTSFPQVQYCHLLVERGGLELPQHADHASKAVC